MIPEYTCAFSPEILQRLDHEIRTFPRTPREHAFNSSVLYGHCRDILGERRCKKACSECSRYRATNQDHVAKVVGCLTVPGLFKTNTRPDFLDEIGASVLEPLGDVSRGYDGFADRFRRLGLLRGDLRKPPFHGFELRFDDGNGAGQDDVVDGDEREGAIVGVSRILCR